jgi:hypothetical protein
VTTTDTAAATAYPVGSLLTARGREWVVQTGSTGQLLLLKPVAGVDDDVMGVMPALEAVVLATFDLSTLDDFGTAADV